MKCYFPDMLLSIALIQFIKSFLDNITNYHLLSTNYVPGPVLRVLHLWSHLISTTTLWGYYFILPEIQWDRSKFYCRALPTYTHEFCLLHHHHLSGIKDTPPPPFLTLMSWAIKKRGVHLRQFEGGSTKSWAVPSTDEP